MDKKGTLFIVATPIGNLKDITIRAIEVLSEVDLIAAEDTRRTRKLTSHYNIHKPLISYHEHSSRSRDEEIIERLKRGENIALVTDAGTPGLSDPGFRLIKRVIEEGLNLTVIPGPSAVLTALLLSGFQPVPFIFLGFPPARGSARKAFFDRYKDLSCTRIFFESPLRLIRALEEMVEFWNNPIVCVARELTKVFEEAVRGPAAELARIFKDRKEAVKGEVTIVAEGSKITQASLIYSDRPDSWLDDFINESILKNPSTPTSELAKMISDQLGISKNKIYKHILKIRKG